VLYSTLLYLPPLKDSSVSEDAGIEPNLILFYLINVPLFVSICLCTPHIACRQNEEKLVWYTCDDTDNKLLLNIFKDMPYYFMIYSTGYYEDENKE
jgi:hypothetical protein